MSAALVWLTRDLRLADHPALRSALDQADSVVCVFCLDPSLLGGRHASGVRTGFLLECLGELRAALSDRGSGLVVRRGSPARELAALAGELGARTVHASRDPGPFARRRASRVAAALAVAGAELHEHPGTSAVDDVTAIASGSGRPYTVFSHFQRRWIEIERRRPLPAPRRLPPLPRGLRTGRIPSLGSLGLAREVADPPPGGEREARRAMRRWLAGPVHDYARDRDLPGAEGTSRLSPYLHLGCLSARELEHRLPEGDGPSEYRRQLCWRDFYQHVLAAFPRNVRSELQPRFRGTMRWSRARASFAAWTEGRTGFPLVDAGMRQLAGEGWMHNRARMVAGSFLTKDLGLDWRWGERWFMRMLLDGDEAANNGNWQWIASVGTDPQPAFRRILSPTRQMERYDPDGTFVRRWVPELRPVPARHLREPWRMPAAVQRECGCVIGEDYPAPIVDHRRAREEALARYREARRA